MKYEKKTVKDITVIEPKGKISAMNANSLLELVTGLLQRGEIFILINFNGVEFIDSSGLGNLVGCLRMAKQKGGNIKISNLSDNIRLVFELICLHQLFEIYTDEEEAIDSFSSERDEKGHVTG